MTAVSIVGLIALIIFAIFLVFVTLVVVKYRNKEHRDKPESDLEQYRRWVIAGSRSLIGPDLLRYCALIGRDHVSGL